jgi:exonuclease III
MTNYFESKKFMLEVDPDELITINDNFEDITGDTVKLTWRKYFWALHAKAISVVKPNNSKKEDLEKIQNLEAEITRLSVLVDEKTNQLNILNADFNNKESEIDLLKAQIRELSGKEPLTIEVTKEVQVPLQLTETQKIINLTPLEKYLFDVVCAQETKRLKKEITPEIVIKNIFNLYMAYGPADFFPRPYSNSELKALNLKFNPPKTNPVNQ